MLTFAHIPTGTTVDKAIDIDDSKSKGVAPATAGSADAFPDEPTPGEDRGRLENIKYPADTGTVTIARSLPFNSHAMEAWCTAVGREP